MRPVRILTACLNALLEAADYAAAAMQYLRIARSPRPLTGCPFDAICQHCVCANADDVCTPAEREMSEYIVVGGGTWNTMRRS